MHVLGSVITNEVPDKTATVNEALLDHLSSYPYQTTDILEPARYSVESSGHRWRPILFLKIYEQLAQREDDVAALAIACAIEYLHTASIILDDLPAMDDARLRRGKKPCHAVFGHARAILASLWLCDLAQSLVHEHQTEPNDRSSRDLESLVRFTKSEMIKGQIMDIEKRNLTKPEIIEKCRLKSGALYAFTCSAPARLLGLSDITGRLERIGSNIGIAYQISDDINDFVCTLEEAGKDVRSDMNKCTLPRMFGMEDAVEVRALNKQKAIDGLRNVCNSADLVNLVERICS